MGKVGTERDRTGIAWRRVLHAACVAAIIGVSLTPGGQMPPVEVSDKLGHLVAYFVLGAITLAAYRSPRRRFWLLLGAVAMGVGLELAQDLVPRRQASLLDALANAAGVGLAALLTTRLFSAARWPWRSRPAPRRARPRRAGS